MLTGFGCEVRDAEAAARLAVVARELDALTVVVDDLVAGARNLAADTDWSARAAEGFSTAAEAWAGEVSSLRCLLEWAGAEVWHAQARAALPSGACR